MTSGEDKDMDMVDTDMADTDIADMDMVDMDMVDMDNDMVDMDMVDIDNDMVDISERTWLWHTWSSLWGDILLFICYISCLEQTLRRERMHMTDDQT